MIRSNGRRVLFPITWLVRMRESGTLTTLRPVWQARALIKEVFPVPGGPCSRSPSLWGYPLMAYLPVHCQQCNTKSEREEGQRWERML